MEILQRTATIPLHSDPFYTCNTERLLVMYKNGRKLCNGRILEYNRIQRRNSNMKKLDPLLLYIS